MSPVAVVLAALLGALVVVRVGLASRRKPRVLFEEPRANHRIVVREDARWRELAFIGEGWDFVHTRVFRSRPRRSGWLYVDGFHLAALLRPDAARALFVGCGGGIAPSQFHRSYPALRIDVVEIDSGIVDIAQRFFGLVLDARLRVHLGDGARFVEASVETYDIIVIDAYDDGAILPELSSARFFERVRDRLAPDGVLCVNVVGATDGPESEPLRRLLAAITATFRGDATTLFAMQGAHESARSRRTDVRRNHLAVVARGSAAVPVKDLQGRARAAAIADAPGVAAAAAWPVIET